MAAFDTFEAMKPQTVVPSHGAMGTGALIAANRAVVSTVQARARELKAQGRSADEAATTIQQELQAAHPAWPRANGVTALARSAFEEAPQAPGPAPQGQAAAPLPPGQTNDPFPGPIAASEGVIRVGAAEFASLPDIDGVAARMMNLVDEPGTRRLFVSDMRGPLYSVSYDGKAVTLYLDVNAPTWGHPVQSTGRERGFQSFVFHPQFAQAGAPGYGKLYTYFDTSNMAPPADFLPAGGDKPTHDTVLLEWTAKTANAGTYDGGAPRELFRLRQPFANHNAGHTAFNPLAAPGSADFGLLYLTIGDGGSGGDPFNMAQNLGLGLRQDVPHRSARPNSRNRQYGIPPGNPFVSTARRAPRNLCLRSAQRAALHLGLEDREHLPRRHRPEHRRRGDARAGWRQPRVERLGRQLSLRQPAGGEAEGRRADPKRHLSARRVRADRPSAAAQLRGERYRRVSRHGDSADRQSRALHRHAERRDLLFQCRRAAAGRAGSDSPRAAPLEWHERTVLQVIQEKNKAQGKTPATRADLRLARRSAIRSSCSTRATGSSAGSCPKPPDLFASQWAQRIDGRGAYGGDEGRDDAAHYACGGACSGSPLATGGPAEVTLMTNMVVYLIGTLLVVAGLAYAATRLGVSQPWIIAGALVIIGLGLMGGIVKTRQKDPAP